MKYAVHAALFVGIRSKDVLVRTKVTSEVTKYDEDTGKRYQKEVSTPKMTLFGRELVGAVSAASPDINESRVKGALLCINKELGIGLKAYCPDPDAKLGSDCQLIGCEVARVGVNHTHAHPIQLDLITETLEKVKAMLAVAGYNGPGPHVYLVFEESC